MQPGLQRLCVPAAYGDGTNAVSIVSLDRAICIPAVVQATCGDAVGLDPIARKLNHVLEVDVALPLSEYVLVQAAATDTASPAQTATNKSTSSASYMPGTLLFGTPLV